MTAREIVANGVWTWFNEPRAIYNDGKTYIGWINSSGDVGVTEFDHSAESASSFTLNSAMEVDDHDNPGIYLRSDGKLLACYSKHNADNLQRYRIASTAGSITGFAAEQTIAETSPCYADLHYLSENTSLYWGYRQGNSTQRDRMRRVSTDSGSTWGSGADWITETNARPYYKSCGNGVDRIDFVMTNGHPNEVAASVYHAYMELDAGTEKFYKSDGTYIGTTMAPGDGTLIYDGSTKDGWVWDISYGSDGHPRVLFTKYESTTDHRYMFSRWTGSAWTTPVQICAAGTHLYSPEVYYSGGMCFDGNSVNKVYVSVQVGSYWELQEYQTTDNGATWSKQRDITSGSSVRNCRPWSPRGHDVKLAVLWWRGTYTTYTNYSTAIWGAG